MPTTTTTTTTALFATNTTNIGFMQQIERTQSNDKWQIANGKWKNGNKILDQITKTQLLLLLYCCSCCCCCQI